MNRQWLCLALLVGVAAPLQAQTPGEPIRLTIHPAAVPTPTLKYQLLPDMMDEKPGNGALLYYRAFSPEWYSWRNRPGLQNKIIDALNQPFKDLPRKELDSIPWSNLIKELDLAARKEYCDWAFGERLRTEGISMLLPDMQEFRNFANLLALRTRLELADGHYDRAAYSLQTGFALARDVGKAPLLICSLVAVAGGAVQAVQIEQWVQMPHAPNLYWALTDLPRPFIPLHHALYSEKLWLAAEFPPLKDIETTVYGPDRVQDLTERMVRLLRVIGDERRSEEGLKLAVMALAVKFYPEAKQALVAAGRKPAEVEALSMLQAYVLHSLHEYRQLQDDMYKWFALPYPQARVGLEQSEKSFRVMRNQLRAAPFLEFLPAVSKVYIASTRLDRRIAALRCVEALRLYAAAHDGKLPNALADITEVPVPLDPMTGEAFRYQASGNKATLQGPAPGEEPAPQNSLTYEITLER